MASFWEHMNSIKELARESTAFANPPISKVWNRFTTTEAGAWFSSLDTRWKIGVGFTAAAMGLAAIRLLHGTLKSDHTSPPTAYQGAYGRIEGLRHSRSNNRAMFSDFGSGLNHSRASRRRIMPSRHNTRHRNFTGLVQNLHRG